EKLFSQGKFRDSMDLFAKVAAPPARVIRLYPPAVAGNISNQIAQAEAEETVAEPPEDEAPPEENGSVEAEVKHNGESEDKPATIEQPPQPETPPPKENGNHPSTPDGTSTP